MGSLFATTGYSCESHGDSKPAKRRRPLRFPICPARESGFENSGLLAIGTTLRSFRLTTCDRFRRSLLPRENRHAAAIALQSSRIAVVYGNIRRPDGGFHQPRRP